MEWHRSNQDPTALLGELFPSPTGPRSSMGDALVAWKAFLASRGSGSGNTPTGQSASGISGLAAPGPPGVSSAASTAQPSPLSSSGGVGSLASSAYQGSTGAGAGTSASLAPFASTFGPSTWGPVTPSAGTAGSGLAAALNKTYGGGPMNPLSFADSPFSANSGRASDGWPGVVTVETTPSQGMASVDNRSSSGGGSTMRSPRSVFAPTAVVAGGGWPSSARSLDVPEYSVPLVSHASSNDSMLSAGSLASASGLPGTTPLAALPSTLQAASSVLHEHSSSLGESAAQLDASSDGADAALEFDHDVIGEIERARLLEVAQGWGDDQNVEQGQ